MSTLLTNFNVREKGQKKKRYEAAHIYPLNPTKEESETLKMKKDYMKM